MNQNSNVNYSQKKRFTEKRFIAAEKTTNKNLTAKTKNPKSLKLLPVI